MQSSCKVDRKKKRLCPVCLHWDPRPEEMSGPGMGYCDERDIITMIRYECEHFEEATRSKVAAKNRDLYGEFEDEEDEEED
jgi:hypothetical protein